MNYMTEIEEDMWELFFGSVSMYVYKVTSEKKETKVDAHISVNFSHFVTNFVCLKRVIFIAFQRGATHYCSFNIREIKATFIKLVRN